MGRTVSVAAGAPVGISVGIDRIARLLAMAALGVVVTVSVATPETHAQQNASVSVDLGALDYLGGGGDDGTVIIIPPPSKPIVLHPPKGVARYNPGSARIIALRSPASSACSCAHRIHLHRRVHHRVHHAVKAHAAAAKMPHVADNNPVPSYLQPAAPTPVPAPAKPKTAEPAPRPAPVVVPPPAPAPPPAHVAPPSVAAAPAPAKPVAPPPAPPAPPPPKVTAPAPVPPPKVNLPPAPVAPAKPAPAQVLTPPPPAKPLEKAETTTPAPSAVQPAPGKPVEITKPTEVAPAPETKPAPDQPIVISYAAGGSAVPDDAAATMKDVSDRLLANPTLRVQLLAYASDPEKNVSRARRLSLERAVAVRKILIDNGLDSTRIEVRALGDQNNGGEPNRVDILLTARR